MTPFSRRYPDKELLEPSSLTHDEEDSDAALTSEDTPGTKLFAPKCKC